MDDLMQWLAIAGFGFAAICVAALAGLKGWQGWLELKRLEIMQRRGSSSGDRIELADLKERIRKLEAIAACVDP